MSITYLKKNPTPISSESSGRRVPSRFERSLAKDSEKQRERGRDVLHRFASLSLNDTCSVVEETEAELARVWDAWTLYFAAVHPEIDPESIWVALCDGVDMSNYIRAFFESCIENSEYDRPCLVSEEYESVRAVNSAITVEGMWKTLLEKVGVGIL
ncbi:hypothetical protein DL769_010349 [Monosporascus sp. CRB-8-3]|nr:hypothetical protein DL769_010349 [Monosporascus sp. CRB-8-3]